MLTFQLAQAVLDGYKNAKLTDERISLLKTQIDEQLEEISQKKEIYESFLEKIDAPKELDNIILWILLMSNETICDDYSDEFDKKFRDVIPVSDLADLLLYIVYLKKFKNIELEGFEYLLEYKEEGIEEVDQFAFTNTFLYIQKSKEVQIEF